ncbi:hypothetical protein H6P81_015851 [Aristolochia fimbriata]|uniref:J domain-containing protein n=1 Tax=Aristolochia fimbriata TaxID=158543 RepID=A0AAV7E9Q1_ARIFI|nr:hypothetical protein H6P81_015851 [Aristolochia fimbriata]
MSYFLYRGFVLLLEFLPGALSDGSLTKVMELFAYDGEFLSYKKPAGGLIFACYRVIVFSCCLPERRYPYYQRQCQCSTDQAAVTGPRPPEIILLPNLSSTVTYGEEFNGQSAYEVLGVSEASTFTEIKASFRKLAKETHLDTAEACIEDPAVASHRFIQILAAYEVKHMHRYTVVDKASPCECRCSRAQLPPSKFWLFEPRCGTDDIGGWYVEKFGRDNEGCIVSSRRQWSAFMPIESLEKFL